MKKVLLLGDSIRVAYQPLAAEKLRGVAEVAGPAENGRFAKFTLWYVDEWFAKFGTPDVIHWNNGLWDVYRHSADQGVFTPPDEYIVTLQRIVVQLKKTGASIIWATTTPVLPGHRHCRNADIDVYNEQAVAVMRAAAVIVNDLNALVKPHAATFIGDDCIHLTEAGNEACAAAVVQAILGCIGSPALAKSGPLE